MGRGDSCPHIGVREQEGQKSLGKMDFNLVFQKFYKFLADLR